MTDATQLTDAWNRSYERRENHVFWPSDEMVRFVSRHIRRRIGANEIVDVAPGAAGSAMLDAGCGVGRNLVFGHSMGLDMHGMDLSQVAVDKARVWLSDAGDARAADKVHQADIQMLPWDDGFFAHAFSESALDSMPAEVARKGVAEIARVMRAGGYFYCSLISGDETGRSADFAGEVLVSEQHEQDTIQWYHNRDTVLDLVAPYFDPVSLALVQTREEAVSDRSAGHHGRWHFVGRRKAT